MISLLAALVTSSLQTADSVPPTVLVRSPDAWIATSGAPDEILVVPIHSRTERRVRARVDDEGIAVRVVSGTEPVSIDTVRARVVVHPFGSRVVIVDGTPTLLGEPTLPFAAKGSHGVDLLPHLARLDLAVVDGGLLDLVPPTPGDDALVAVLVAPEDGRSNASIRYGYETESGNTRDGLVASLPPGPHAARVLGPFPDGRPSRLRLSLENGAVDELSYRRVSRPEARELGVQSARRREARLVGWTRFRGRGALRPVVEAGADIGAAPGLEERLAHADGVREELAPGQLVELVLGPAPTLAEGFTATYLLEVSREGGARAEPEHSDGHGFLVDVAREAGVDVVHLEGPDEQVDIRPTMGPGAAWGDVDGDSWVDLYVVQGGGREGSAPPLNRLYRNRGDGAFADVSAASGTDDSGAGMGALFFDAEGDGDLDLYVANYGPDALYLNGGDGRFERVDRAGVGGDLWSAGVAAADVDGDLDLDLYVTSYLRYDESQMPHADELGTYLREDPIPMLPFAFPGERNTLLRNDTRSSGPSAVEAAAREDATSVHFEDVTAELGVEDATGRGMQPVFWDFDRDGDADLYVANDVSPNALWRNEGNGRFRDVAFATGMDDPRGGMGVAIGDVDLDGDMDLFLTNWQLETNALYENNLVSHRSARNHVATFRDVTVKAGLGPSGIGVTSWAAELFDADLDGDLDLFVANGYTSPDYESTGICVGQPNQYFENDGEGRFREASAAAGPALAVELASRATVACDYDQDGLVDLAVTANNGSFQLLHNEHPPMGRWLGIRLRSSGPNTHGIGAEVTIRAGDRLWRRPLLAGAGYLGGNPPELHFGLGAIEEVDAIEVRWPDGRTSRHEAPELSRWITLEEPE